MAQKVKCPYCGKELVKIGGHYRYCTKKKNIYKIIYTIGITSIIMMFMGGTLCAIGLFFFFFKIESTIGLVGGILFLVGLGFMIIFILLVFYFDPKTTIRKEIFETNSYKQIILEILVFVLVILAIYLIAFLFSFLK